MLNVILQTALLVAVTANQPEIVQDLLLLGADINACDFKGQTALHLAAHYGFPAVLQVKKQQQWFSFLSYPPKKVTKEIYYFILFFLTILTSDFYFSAGNSVR